MIDKIQPSEDSEKDAVQQQINVLLDALREDTKLQRQLARDPIRVFADYGMGLEVVGQVLAEIGYPNPEQLSPRASVQKRNAAMVRKGVTPVCKKKATCYIKSTPAPGPGTTKNCQESLPWFLLNSPPPMVDE